MVAIGTINYRQRNIEEFIESFSESPATNYYITIGKDDAWPSSDTPPTPTFSDNDIVTIYNDILALKKVDPGNVVRVTPRVDWASGKVFDKYDAADPELYDKEFYVLTDDFNVYKCIDNNSGAASTAKPTGTLTTNITTADSYVWKYMYTISGGDILQFLTDDWMPVRNNATVTAAANPATTTPYFGHGFSAVHELFAHYAMIVVKITDTEGGDFPINTQFRQVCLLENPKNAANSALFTDTTGTLAEIKVGSGRLLVVSNRLPTLRAADQTETLKVLVSF